MSPRPMTDLSIDRLPFYRQIGLRSRWALLYLIVLVKSDWNRFGSFPVNERDFKVSLPLVLRVFIYKQFTALSLVPENSRQQHQKLISKGKRGPKGQSKKSILYEHRCVFCVCGIQRGWTDSSLLFSSEFRECHNNLVEREELWVPLQLIFFVWNLSCHQYHLTLPIGVLQQLNHQIQMCRNPNPQKVDAHIYNCRNVTTSWGIQRIIEFDYRTLEYPLQMTMTFLLA